MSDLRESIEKYTENKPVADPIYTVPGLEKQAGIFVYQPTIDRMSDKVREYLMNETAFFPKRYPVDVHIQPTEMQDTKSKDYIRNGEGIASLNMAGNVLEFPFHIRDAEFDPFFVINHKKQSVPFTRDNLKKIMYGIEKAMEDAKGGGEHGRNVIDGYKSLAKKVTPATASGFLASGVNFRSEQKSKRGPQMMSLAANVSLDEMMEKLATMDEFTMEKRAFLEDKITERLVAEEFTKSMEKIASTESTPSEYAKVEAMDFIDLNRDSRVKHGDAVEIPVYELDKNKGYYSSYVSKTGMFIHIGGVKGVLCPNAEFIAINGPTIGKKTKTKVSVRKSTLGNLSSSDCAIIGVNGKYSTVVGALEEVETLRTKSKLTGRAVDNRLDVAYVNLSAGKKGIVVPDNSTAARVTLNSAVYSSYNSTAFAAINVPGMKTLKKYQGGGDFHSNKSNLKENIANDIIQSGSMTYADFQSTDLFSPFSSYSERPSVILVGDLNQVKVIPLRLASVNTFRSKKDIFDMFDSTADMRIQKTASRETVSIRKDKESGKYNLSIDYKDPDKKIFKGMNRSLYGLEPEKLKGVLTYLGYDDLSADSIQNRAERVPATSHTLPTNHKAKSINVGDVESKARMRAKKIVNASIESKVPTLLLATGTYGVVRDMMTRYKTGKNREKAENVVGFLSGKPTQQWKESSDLSSQMSGQFEKVAMDFSSPFALKVAKTMNISSRYFDKIASVQDGHIYDIKDVSKNILSSKEEFNKIACRLVELHETQLDKGETAIDSRMIKEAIEHIDLMLKSADEAVR